MLHGAYDFDRNLVNKSADGSASNRTTAALSVTMSLSDGETEAQMGHSVSGQRTG